MPLDPVATLEEAEDLVLAVSEAKADDNEAIAKAVAQFLDAILPLDAWIPGPLGQTLERHDDQALEALIHHLSRVFHADPAKKAARIERRKRRREEREERKAQRRAEAAHGR